MAELSQKTQNRSQFKGHPRLPKFAIPKRYDLKLKPDLAACKFFGTVQISVDVVSGTEFLVLNAAELSVDPKFVTFTSAPPSLPDSSPTTSLIITVIFLLFCFKLCPGKFLVLESVEVELFEEDEILVLEFKEYLAIGFGVLNIEFDGTLNDRMKGFYFYRSFTCYEKAEDVERFFASRVKPYIARTLKQSIERVHINTAWVKSTQSEIHLAEAVKELAHRK
ncbi:hypothetical protein OROGR_005981 [Orobanche gracilis]